MVDGVDGLTHSQESPAEMGTEPPMGTDSRCGSPEPPPGTDAKPAGAETSG